MKRNGDRLHLQSPRTPLSWNRLVRCPPGPPPAPPRRCFPATASFTALPGTIFKRSAVGAVWRPSRSAASVYHFLVFVRCPNPGLGRAHGDPKGSGRVCNTSQDNVASGRVGRAGVKAQRQQVRVRRVAHGRTITGARRLTPRPYPLFPLIKQSFEKPWTSCRAAGRPAT